MKSYESLFLLFPVKNVKNCDFFLLTNFELLQNFFHEKVPVMICNLSLVHWASGTVKLVANLSGSTVSRAGHASYISAELGTPHTFQQSWARLIHFLTRHPIMWFYEHVKQHHGDYHTSFSRSSYSHM